MDKSKLKRFVDKYVTIDCIQSMFFLIIIVLLVLNQIKKDVFSWESMLDISILFSFLIAFVSGSIAKVISKYLSKKYEDSIKLTEDYTWLVKKYTCEKLVTYKEERFPVIPIIVRNEKDEPFSFLFIEDNNKKYELPEQVRDRSEWLMKAHENSFVYNNINVRINDIRINNSLLELIYSRTTYYDSLITNRAMDYEWENGKTNREVYEPGPFVNCLADSKMSNHLGFNGFVETQDGKIIFVKRSNKLSIGKNTLADSVGASFKAKYGLDNNCRMTIETLRRAIRNEIYDELKIKIDENVELENCIFAFYRDLVEGGKPQFLFYYKLNDLTANQFKQNFFEVKNTFDKKIATIDGDKFIYLSRDEIKACDIHPGELVLSNNKKYKIMPSASAAIVMLLEYLGYTK